MFAITEDVVDLPVRRPVIDLLPILMGLRPKAGAYDDLAATGLRGTARQTSGDCSLGPMAVQRWESEGGALPPRRYARQASRSGLA